MSAEDTLHQAPGTCNVETILSFSGNTPGLFDEFGMNKVPTIMLLMQPVFVGVCRTRHLRLARVYGVNGHGGCKVLASQKIPWISIGICRSWVTLTAPGSCLQRGRHGHRNSNVKTPLLSSILSLQSLATPIIFNHVPNITMPSQEASPTGYLQIGSKDRSVGWYDPPITSIPKPVRDLLENYSHVPPEEVIPRIIETRDKIWDVFPWPCVGQFRFLDLSLSQQPSYPAIMQRLVAGDRLLDVGCCLGQDLRKLAHDGAPPASLFGLEMQGEFISLAYEFFNDRDGPFRAATFIQADVLDVKKKEVAKVAGSFGIVHLGMVLHIWDLELQTKACERLVELLRDAKGVIIVGQSVGNVAGKEVYIPSRGHGIYKHDVDTFAAMWKEVGRRTGTEWIVRAQLDSGLGIKQQQRNWDEASTRRLSFEVVRV